MSITLDDGVLTVTEQDHRDLYDLYCEEDKDEAWGKFKLVSVQHDGTWRHGPVRLLVVEVEGHEGLWGLTVQDQDGDEYWSSLSPDNGYGADASLFPVEAVPSVTYQIRK